MSRPPAAAESVFGSRLGLAEQYAKLLAGEGQLRGLIGPAEIDRLWDRHLVNCAALRHWLPDAGIAVDLGSGSGLPGVVLAILRPDLEMVLLEPLLRRTTFLQRVVDELRLANARVVRLRANEYAARWPAQADCVVARAVAPLHRLVGWAAPIVAPGGWVLALKGAKASRELAEARPVLDSLHVVRRSVETVADGDNLTQVVRLMVGESPSSRMPHGNE